MKLRAPRGSGEALASIACFIVVLASLVAVDDRVRERIALHVSGENVATLSKRAAEIADVLLDVARDQSIAHAPLLVFSVVAVVLVMFMLRT